MSKPFYSRYVCIQCLLAVFSILVTIGGIVVIAVGAFVENKLSRYLFRNELSVQKLTIVIILIGCLLVLTEVIGFYGTSCDKSVKLKIYIGLSSAFLLAELTCGVASTVMLSNVADRINTNLQLYIQNYHSSSVYRTAVDIFQNEFVCCGARSSREYLNRVPLSCYSNQSLHSVGCTPALDAYVRSYLTILMVTVFSVSFVQLASILLASILLHKYLRCDILL
ncbi:uncharacterized protein DEA37_0014911 [Paragonimus westermani]|uniref:Tetraspanin n=1 Tax=Paragonimus westermani TaxID=34504 RepID=A0A5J4N8A5_9TREM|nr:uncharacterized protein DEA37_0014911 [Paragonimus westermani]